MQAEKVSNMVLSEDMILSEVESIVSRHGSYSIWIIGLTEEPEVRRSLRGAVNWNCWCTGDGRISHRVCKHFESKGMVVDASSDNPSAKYVYMY